MSTLTPADAQSNPPADSLFDLLNMWWHRVGFDAARLPPYSQACLRCGGTIRLLYTGATCPNCNGTGLRLSVLSQTSAPAPPSAPATTADAGPVAGYATYAIGSRTAQFALPVGW